MNAFTASRGEVRAVSDAEILDAYSLLGAREGVFCEPASAASVAGLLKNGAEGRVVCVLTGPRAEGPADRDEPRRERRALRAGHRERRARGAGMRRRRLVRVPASSANLGPGYDVLAAALSLHLELEVEETGEFFVHSDVARRPDRPLQPVRARVRAPAPGRRLTFQIRSEIPAAAGLGSSAAAIVAGLAAADHMYELDAPLFELAAELEGHPGQRRRGAPRRLRDLPGAGRGAGALRPAARASRACSRSRTTRCRRRRRARRCRPRCRWRTRCTTSATPRCSCSGSRRTTSA